MSTPLSLPQLKTRRFGRKLYFFEAVSSTQDVLKEMIQPETPEGLTVLAEEQIHGRGRQGRVWESLPGKQLLFSTYVCPVLSLKYYPLFSIASGLAVISALQPHLKSMLTLKWPNDVLLGGKKVCGILSELHKSGTRHGLALGIGINVMRSDFPKPLKKVAAAMEPNARGSLDRHALLAEVLYAIEHYVDLLQSEEKVHNVQKEFEALWHFRDEEIQVELNHHLLRGKASSIDRDGALLLRTSSDEPPRRVVSGDVLKVS